MTYTASQLQMISAGTPQVFKYWTNDLLNAVTASGYFNADYAKFQKGDLIVVAGDLDGTPFTTQLTVSSATGATTVTTTDLASATIIFSQKYMVSATLAAVGTAETTYITVPIAGSVTRVTGVVNANGAGSGGTSTVTISVPTTGAIATLPFAQDYVAGTAVNDATITAHTALAADGVITVTTDGTGSHTGLCRVTLMITPS